MGYRGLQFQQVFHGLAQDRRLGCAKHPARFLEDDLAATWRSAERASPPQQAFRGVTGEQAGAAFAIRVCGYAANRKHKVFGGAPDLRRALQHGMPWPPVRAIPKDLGQPVLLLLQEALASQFVNPATNCLPSIRFVARIRHNAGPFFHKNDTQSKRVAAKYIFRLRKSSWRSRRSVNAPGRDFPLLIPR